MSKIEQSAKRQQNPNTQKTTRAGARLAAGLMGIATIFGPTACENPANGDNGPKKCDCPDKIHGDAPCNCGGEDCECKQKEYNNLVNFSTLTVVDETAQGLVTEDFINTLDGYFLELANDSIFIGLKNNGRNYKMIIRDDLVGDYYLSNNNLNQIMVKFGSLAFRMIGAIIDCLYEGFPTEQDLTATYFPNNNIRLENGETINTKQFIESGKKFDNAKIRLSRAVIQSRSGLVI
jgi:hypothetical protein